MLSVQTEQLTAEIQARSPTAKSAEPVLETAQFGTSGVHVDPALPQDSEARSAIREQHGKREEMSTLRERVVAALAPIGTMVVLGLMLGFTASAVFSLVQKVMSSFYGYDELGVIEAVRGVL